MPGAIGRITELHGDYYFRMWNFGVYFEAKVASELADFLQSFDSVRDGFWTAVIDERIIGSIAVTGRDAGTKGARLRWFILDEEFQGQGLGKALMEEAMAFCRRAGFRRVYLTTFAGLDAARHLYETAGFRLIAEKEGNNWGKTVTEQTFELIL